MTTRSLVWGFWVGARGGLWCAAMALCACSTLPRDCYETRDCPSPGGFIGAGGDGSWWDPGGAAGEPELGLLQPEASGGQASRRVDTAGEGGESGAPTEDSNAPPRVLRVSPSDGALGVESDAELVIHFSQPMNADAVAAAYQSSDLPAALATFEWNAAFTTLTITPATRLAYASGGAAADGSAPFVAKTYHYGFDGAAMDSAGQPLAAVSFTFSTLREVTAELAANAALSGNWTNSASDREGIHNCIRSAKPPYAPSVCVGDDPSGVRYSGFLSFDLSAFPQQIGAFSRAKLHADGRIYGTPESLGESRLDHVFFVELDADELSSAALATLGPFYARPTSSNDTELLLGGDLTSALADDYANRAARANRSQYRLSFSKGAADGVWDDVEMPTSSVRLSVAYLVP